MNPQFPIYIISKGRWESRKTARYLEKIDVPYRIVVEQSEYDQYASVIDKSKILVLPQEYLDEYNTCDDLGNLKSKGSGGSRNFCWDHSISDGFEYHWVLDDNIDNFVRLNNNQKIVVGDGTIFRCAEDFVRRYENVPLASFNYTKFAKKTDKLPPFVLNTRCFSCLLIRNDGKHRWEGRYNEDLHLSLRILKDGDCTIQFNAFLCEKNTTQRVAGGNTKDLYQDGTYDKSKMICDLHPDVSTMAIKFSRIHHHVDFRPFKKNALKRKQDITIPTEPNEYGMVIKKLDRKFFEYDKYPI